MKREGRQHGMVRTFYVIPAPFNLNRRDTSSYQIVDSTTTAGVFTKVSTNPTNHSKFTGKCSKARCGECHGHPVCKSKAKTKGNQKLRSGDSFSGVSASEVLNELAYDYSL